MAEPLRALYPDWPQHNGRIRDALRDLPPEALALRAGPDHAPVWALAAHVAGTRVYWLCGVFGEPGADGTPFPDAVTGVGWEDDPDHPRSGGELADALDRTFAIVEATLGRWTVDDLGHTAIRRFGGVEVAHTRASVLNRLFSHDAFHAGEISQLLGLHALPEIDLWRRPTPPGPAR